MPDQALLLIYSPRVSSRSKYIFRLFFNELLHLNFRFSDDIGEFIQYKGPKFSYAGHPVSDELFFYSTSLLFENGIKHQSLHFTQFRELPCFYLTRQGSALPFDPFAAAFFLISRYEEYMPHIKDNHGRFSPQQSVAFKNGFLKKPLINIWAGWIQEILLKHFPGIKVFQRKFSFVPTIDIDNAWAYKRKGFIRIGGGFITDALELNFKRMKERFCSVFSLCKDPYDTYDYQYKLFEEYRFEPVYFILLGDYDTYDKNIPYQNKFFQSLIKFLADIGKVGIHPSYGSNEKPDKLKEEIHRLSQILNQDVHRSRQHFLKLNLPQTYHNLRENDITDDYTMGYPDKPGFRASICTSFNFYDLDTETETALRIHPFCLMDGTLKDYLMLEPDETFSIIDELMAEVKAVQGEFISVWHNESFAENERWKGWRKVYEYLLNKAHYHA